MGTLFLIWGQRFRIHPLGRFLPIVLCLSCLAKPNPVGLMASTPALDIQSILPMIHSEESQNLQRAVIQLNALRKQNQSLENEPHIHFLLGYSYFLLERWPYAELHFNALKESYPILLDYTLNLLAESQNQQGFHQKAAENWKNLYQKISHSRFAYQARLSEAKSLLLAGDYSHAYQTFKSLYGSRRMRRRFHGQRSEIYLGRAKALVGLKRGKQATYVNKEQVLYHRASGLIEMEEALRGLYGLNGLQIETTQDLWKFSNLQKIFTKKETERLASSLYKKDFHRKSLDLYQNLLKIIDDKNDLFRYEFNIGRNLYYLREYHTSFQTFVKLLNELEQDLKKSPLYDDLLFWAAESSSRMQKEEIARSYYQSFLKHYPGYGRSDDALFRLALTYYYEKDYDNAQKELGRFLKRYPRPKHSRYFLDALWYRGWCLYRIQEYDQAIKLWKRLTYRHRRYDDWRERALYWIGRSYEQMDNIDKAILQYQDIIRKLPHEYYAHTSNVRLMKLGFSSLHPPPLPHEFPLPGNEDPQLDLNEHFKGESHLNEHILKAIELSQMGFKEWASDELFERQNSTRGTERLINMALLYRGLNDYTRSSYVSRVYFHPTLTNHYDEGDDQEKLLERKRIWTLAYPRAHQKTVDSIANQEKIDPYLIWTIMRQESNFRPKAISPANAIGLMQILPKTASSIHGKRVEVKDLFDPGFNIELGAKYLSYLLKNFQNRIILVAAAYNAGPHRAQDWQADNGSLPLDEFIEEIPFRETRNYVKRVLRIFANYTQLYGSDDFNPEFFSPFTRLKGKGDLLPPGRLKFLPTSNAKQRLEY